MIVVVEDKEFVHIRQGVNNYNLPPNAPFSRNGLEDDGKARIEPTSLQTILELAGIDCRTVTISEYDELLDALVTPEVDTQDPEALWYEKGVPLFDDTQVSAFYANGAVCRDSAASVKRITDVILGWYKFSSEQADNQLWRFLHENVEYAEYIKGHLPLLRALLRLRRRMWLRQPDLIERPYSIKDPHSTNSALTTNLSV